MFIISLAPTTNLFLLPEKNTGGSPSLPLAAQIRERVRDGTPFCSLEFYPPFKEDADSLGKFMETVGQLREAHPLFVDITWTRRNDPGNLARRNSSTFVAAAIRQLFEEENTMLHLCCNGYTRAETLAHLEQAVQLGIQNIMALRGDLPENGGTLTTATASKPMKHAVANNGTSFNATTTTKTPAPLRKNGLLVPPLKNGQQRKDFYAADLVKWIREREASGYDGGRSNNRRAMGMMGIAVAGDPSPPRDAGIPYPEHMAHLKNKVDAGADFIVTQFFLAAQTFEQFVRDCRAWGIAVPILPGILLFKSAVSLKKIAAIANVRIPPSVARVLDANRGNPGAVQNYALHLAYKMCRHLLATGQTIGVHIFTMNQQKSAETLLKQLGFWLTIPRKEPWQQIHGRLTAAEETATAKAAAKEQFLVAAMCSRPAKCVLNDQKLYSFKCRFYA